MGTLLAVGAATLVLVAFAGLDRLALALLRPPHRPPGRTPGDVGLEAKDWNIPGDPPLVGWKMKGEDATGPVVLLAHGWGANGAVLLPLARALAPRASWILTYDVRGHGRSERASIVSIRQFRDDAMRAIEAATVTHTGVPVVLVGHSLGGAAGVLAAAKGAPIAGLILVAAPYDVYGAIARYLEEKGLPGRLLVPLLKPFWRFRVGASSRALHPGLALRRTAVDTLVIQPEKDTRILPRDGERLAEAAGTPLALIPGAGHTDVLVNPLTGNAARAFLARLA